MKIAIDFHTLIHNLSTPDDLDSGVLNHELIELLGKLKDEHELVLRVCLTNFSFSQLNSFLDENNIECWFEGIEVVTNDSQFLVTDRAITSSQFMEIGTWNMTSESFDECVAFNQSQFT